MKLVSIACLILDEEQQSRIYRPTYIAFRPLRKWFKNVLRHVLDVTLGFIICTFYELRRICMLGV